MRTHLSRRGETGWPRKATSPPGPLSEAERGSKLGEVVFNVGYVSNVPAPAFDGVFGIERICLEDL